MSTQRHQRKRRVRDGPCDSMHVLLQGEEYPSGGERYDFTMDPCAIWSRLRPQ